MDGKWVVLKQEPLTVLLDAGGYGPVIRITFRTASGVVSYVDVPRADYSLETARAAIDAHAAELDAVAGL